MSDKQKCEHCDYWYKIGYGDAQERAGIAEATIAQQDIEIERLQDAIEQISKLAVSGAGAYYGGTAACHDINNLILRFRAEAALEGE